MLFVYAATTGQVFNRAFRRILAAHYHLDSRP